MATKTAADIFRKRDEQKYYKEQVGIRNSERQAQKIKDAEDAQKQADKLKERRERSRATKQGDWYSIMIYMLEDIQEFAKAIHSSAFSKRVETVISDTAGSIWDKLKGKIVDPIRLKFKSKEELPSVNFDVKMDDNNNCTCEIKINGSISLRDYFDANTPKGAELAHAFEAHFQKGFKAWLQSKGLTIDTSDPKKLKIKNQAGQSVTHQDLEKLNQGPGNLSEFLKQYKDIDLKKVTAAVEDETSSTPRP